MFTNTRKNLFIALLAITTIFSINVVNAANSPLSKYKIHGQIAEIDKAKRQLTIETNIFKTKNNKNFLSLERKVFELALGVKLLNVPKSIQYSGIKHLQAGALVYFNVKSGTEKNKIPVISEIYVDFQ